MKLDDGWHVESCDRPDVTKQDSAPPSKGLLSEYPLWDPVVRSGLAHLPQVRGWRILDLGCGRGMLARHLASLGATVVALDASQAHDWHPPSAGAPCYLIGRGERLPFKNNSFDAVTSCSSLQYQDHRETFAELIRVTRDGGMLLLHENMPSNPFVLAYRHLRKRRAARDPHIAGYLSGIRDYLSPQRIQDILPFPELHLVGSEYFYFLTPLASFSRRQSLTNAATALDRALLRTVPFLRRYSWFCAYRISVAKDGRRNLTRSPSIGEAFKRFGASRESRELFLGLSAVLRQGRLVEAMYGVFCFAARRPMPVVASRENSGVIDACLAIEKRIRSPSAETARLLSQIEGVPRNFGTRPELIASTARGHVIGEYSHVGRSARLFHVVDGIAHQFDYYAREPGVRHLHSIVAICNDKLLICTGDSSKYLDEWHIRDTELVFSRRLMRHLAGFTSHAKIGDAIYFGTDFSERPNYLFRFHDRRKFFLPKPSFRQYVRSMAPYEDRYIMCCCDSLYGHRTVAIFDTSSERFIYCKELGPD